VTRYQKRYLSMVRDLIRVAKRDCGYKHVPAWMKPAIRSHASHYARLPEQ